MVVVVSYSFRHALTALLAAAVLAGAAGCIGADDKPSGDGNGDGGTASDDATPASDATPGALDGAADTGPAADASPSTDAAPNGDTGLMDAADPADGAPSDAAPSDAGPHTWQVTAIGSTDTDWSIALRVGPSGPKIGHNEEDGRLVYTSATGGVWRTDNLVLDEQTSCVQGCNMYLSMELDGAERAHIAYRFVPPHATARQYGSEIRYLIVDGSTVSTPLDLESVPEPASTSGAGAHESAPGLAVESDGTAHVVYRATAEPLSSVRYVRISGGVASAPVTIPSSTTSRQWAYPVRTGALVAGIDASGKLTVLAEPTMNGATVRALQRTAAGWQTPIALPLVGPVTAATVGNDGTVHVIAPGTSTTALAYATISSAGVVTARDPLPLASCGAAFLDGVALSIATDGNGEPAVACTSHNGNGNVARAIFYVPFRGGAWSTPEVIDYPAGASEPEGVTPSLTFDALSVPHVAFQGFDAVAPDLFYATFQ